jgi:hypothetical protein
MAATADHPNEQEFQSVADPLLDSPPSTDFATFVTDALAQSHHCHLHNQRDSSSTAERIDQNVLRQCINLSSSFLLTDVATNPGAGISTWSTGLNRLVDIVIVLHKRNELEVDTISAASKACSECWTIAGNWRGLDDCRQSVREIGGRLKKVLDPDEHTYGGQRVYAP